MTWVVSFSSLSRFAARQRDHARPPQEKDIRVLWHMFKKHDKERRSIIAISDFYDKIVFVPRTIFCDGLFDLIEAADSESIDFGEFVAAVTTYCFFEIPEVLKFCFFVFDRDKKGFITQEEMRLFVDAMHGNEMSTNVEFALDNLKYRKDGKFDFEEFKGMHHLYPSVLFPAFRSVAQRPLRRWRRHGRSTQAAERDDAGHGRRAVLGVEEAGAEHAEGG